MVRARLLSSLVLALWAASAPAHASARELALDMRKWQVVPQDSGPVNYYRVVEDADGVYIRSEYKPPLETMTRGFQLADGDRHAFHKLRWKWRALALPKGGNECMKGRGDSAAVVYLTWRAGLKWYALKYVWSPDAPKGFTCDRKSNLFRAQATVILESGGPLNTWMAEAVDLDSEWRRNFADGNPKAQVPDFMGVGIMSDGDQTHSVSSADFGGFVLSD